MDAQLYVQIPTKDELEWVEIINTDYFVSFQVPENYVQLANEGEITRFASKIEDNEYLGDGAMNFWLILAPAEIAEGSEPVTEERQIEQLILESPLEYYQDQELISQEEIKFENPIITNSKLVKYENKSFVCASVDTEINDFLGCFDVLSIIDVDEDNFYKEFFESINFAEPNPDWRRIEVVEAGVSFKIPSGWRLDKGFLNLA